MPCVLSVSIVIALCTLHSAQCTLHVARCMLHVASCVYWCVLSLSIVIASARTAQRSAALRAGGPVPLGLAHVPAQRRRHVTQCCGLG